MKTPFCSLLVILTLIFTGVDAQQNNSVPIFTAKTGSGVIFQTNDFLRGENNRSQELRRYNSAGASFAWQTVGKRDWQHIHNFPTFGFSIYTAKLDYDDEIGQPIALNAFYKAPFFRKNNSALQYKIGFGVATNWKEYDDETNPNNITIGSHFTTYIEAGFEYDYILANRWQFGVGGEFSHFSNGAIRKPNKGLNMFTPYATLGYLLKPMPKLERRFDIERNRHNEVFAAVGGGIKRIDYSIHTYPKLKSPYQDNIFYLATLSVGYMRQYGNRGKYGAGVNLIYDDWLGSSITIDNDSIAQKHLGEFGDRLSVGIFAAHEFCIDRLSILTQLGCYVWRKTDLEQEKPLINERVGLKYHFANDIFMGINIYAHNFSKADFIEFNFGKRLVF